MICPFCRHDDSRVVDSRPAEEGTLIRRRRECTSCQRRFTTSETSVLLIVKRSGATEPFSREKVIAGVRKACQGRPVNDDDLVIGEMTPRQKALFNIFQSEGSDMAIRECAYEMIQNDIREDPRIIEKKNSGKEGMGMCVGYLIVLY